VYSVYSGPGKQVGLHGLLGKRWLIPLLVILIIVLAVETAILVIIVSQSVFGGRQVFPGISLFRLVAPGCPTLVWSVESTTSSNQSILFRCAKGAALLVSDPLDFSISFEKNPYSPVVGVIPTFSLPRGYLALSLTSQSCSSGAQFIPLKSGQEIGLGGYSSSYNYCAVTDNSVSQVDSFTIDWSNGTPPIFRPAPFTMIVSPTTETVPSGRTANYTITLASLGGWTGNVTVGLRGGYTLGLGYVSPPSLVLKAGGSNNTTLRQPTCNADRTYCTPSGTHTVIVMASTSCLVTVPGGWCVDGYDEVDIRIDINVV